MRIALVQLASPLDEPAAERVARVGSLLDTLDPVDLVVLPELWPSGYFAFDRYAELAEGLDGPLLGELRWRAARLGTHLHIGSLLERAEGGRLHNTAVLLGPDGAPLLHYRKTHVFGYRSLEAELLEPGDGADAVGTALGTVATTTCYDLRFPELYRLLVDRGAELLVVPAAWPAARLDHWRLLTRVRAVENQMVVIACNAGGAQGEVALGGHSMVVDPWGRVVAEAGDGEEVLYAEVDTSLVAELRAEFPVLGDRRLAVDPVFRPHAGRAGRL